MIITTLASVLYLTTYSNAQDCRVGWPVMLGPDGEQDGDTEVTVWVETRDSNKGDKYIIGGRSTS